MDLGANYTKMSTSPPKQSKEELLESHDEDNKDSPPQKMQLLPKTMIQHCAKQNKSNQIATTIEEISLLTNPILSLT